MARPTPDTLDGKLLFETARLACRRWCETDLAALYAVYSDKQAARWVDDGQPISMAECAEWLEVTRKNYQARGYGMFALELRTTRQVIGFCGLVHPGGQEMAEVKYAFLQQHWGQGLASEAVPALLQYAVSGHGLRRIIATVAEPNTASRRVLEKAGMVEIDFQAELDGTHTVVYDWVPE